jgi:hypothetical protein
MILNWRELMPINLLMTLCFARSFGFGLQTILSLKKMILRSKSVSRLMFGIIFSHGFFCYRAIGILKYSDLLKIEDILPLFPDFVHIDDFKDELCNALEHYNQHIEDLKADMDDATRSSESIRQDIRDLNKRSVFDAAAFQLCLTRFDASL